MKKIAVDSGKYETKAVFATNNLDDSKDKKIKFATTLRTNSSEWPDKDSYSIEYEGNSYMVGIKSMESDYDSSKDNEIHKLCIYTAIGSLIDDDTDVDVVIGCPLDIFGNKEKRETYLNNMLPIGKTINITINGKVKSFTIKNARVLPEGSGAIYQNCKAYSQDIVDVIDIGGLNVNGAEFDNLKICPEKIFTKEFGSNTLITDLRDYLVDKHGFDRAKLSRNIMEKAIKDGSVKNIPESAEKIKEIKLRKAQAIKTACDEKKWDVRLTTVIFTGGTSLLLEEELKEVFKVGDEAFSEDCVFANARGFLKFIRNK